jgi:magnesium-transporting ATPase (P-type)
MRSVNILTCLKGLYNRKVQKIKTSTNDLNFHKLSLNELAGYFNTSLTDGLSEVESKQLLTKNGKNILQHYKKKHFFKVDKLFVHWILWPLMDRIDSFNSLLEANRQPTRSN